MPERNAARNAGAIEPSSASVRTKNSRCISEVPGEFSASCAVRQNTAPHRQPACLPVICANSVGGEAVGVWGVRTDEEAGSEGSIPVSPPS